MTEKQKAFNTLKIAFREFEAGYNQGGYSYFALDVRGLYYRMGSTDIPVPRMTILHENLGQLGDVYVVWDTLWNVADASTHNRMVDMADKSGIRVHGIMIAQEELQKSLTILVQPLGGLATRLHVSPMQGFYRRILDYAKDNDGRRDFKLPIPRHFYEPKDGDDKSKVKIKKEEAASD